MDVIFTSCATESNNAAIAAALSHGRGAIMWPAVQEGVKKSRFGRAL
jgi:cysteine sulfinate desulfinase/cysteine desulfurase-like protein